MSLTSSDSDDYLDTCRASTLLAQLDDDDEDELPEPDDDDDDDDDGDENEDENEEDDEYEDVMVSVITSQCHHRVVRRRHGECHHLAAVLKLWRRKVVSSSTSKLQATCAFPL